MSPGATFFQRGFRSRRDSEAISDSPAPTDPMTRTGAVGRISDLQHAHDDHVATVQSIAKLVTGGPKSDHPAVNAIAQIDTRPWIGAQLPDGVGDRIHRPFGRSRILFRKEFFEPLTVADCVSREPDPDRHRP